MILLPRGVLIMSVRYVPLLLCLLLTASTSQAAEVGKPVADVRLTGVDGKMTTLHALKGKSAVVAVFVSFECPVSTSYVPLLNELAKTYQSKNVAFVALAPTQDEPASLAKQAKEFEQAFPLYRDDELKAARALSAKRVPEAFVLDRDLVLRYRGRIDDGYAARLQKKQKKEHDDLRDAVEAVLAGKAVREAVTEAVGCPIIYPREKTSTG